MVFHQIFEKVKQVSIECEWVDVVVDDNDDVKRLTGSHAHSIVSKI